MSDEVDSADDETDTDQVSSGSNLSEIKPNELLEALRSQYSDEEQAAAARQANANRREGAGSSRDDETPQFEGQDVMRDVTVTQSQSSDEFDS